jgi:NAD(P)-dependent dehydrogenase (short-subunit alcohol dehydrogenase family)
MTSHILVLGAGGRLGYAAARAFRDAGWTVTKQFRTPRLTLPSRAP